MLHYPVERASDYDSVLSIAGLQIARRRYTVSESGKAELKTLPSPRLKTICKSTF